MDKVTSQLKARVLITQKLQSQITVLHSQCPPNKEWSGLLLFRVLEGSIEDQINLKIQCEDVFVMDFGDSTFTSFEASTDWLTFFEKFPQVDPTKRNQENKDWYIGKIHSHHNMSAFHSQTDTQDLVDNAPKLPFFLSLVVNYSCNPFAEIAVAGETEVKTVSRNKWNLKNFRFGDNKIEKKAEKKAFTYIIPCDVFYLAEQYLLDQVEMVRERNKQSVPTGYPKNQWDWRKDTKEIKPPRPNSNPKGYRQVLDRLTELLVLGQGTTATFDVAPSTAYDFIDYYINIPTKEDYLISVKGYFVNEWFGDHFYTTNLTEEDVINSIRTFTGWEAQNTKWITKDFNKMLDELEEEIKLLRKVQGYSVV